MEKLLRLLEGYVIVSWKGGAGTRQRAAVRVDYGHFVYHSRYQDTRV
ncbi:MAG: hypothetical protein ACLR45_01125 [Christensenellaceae bacterium]